MKRYFEGFISTDGVTTRLGFIARHLFLMVLSLMLFEVVGVFALVLTVPLSWVNIFKRLRDINPAAEERTLNIHATLFLFASFVPILQLAGLYLLFKGRKKS